MHCSRALESPSRTCDVILIPLFWSLNHDAPLLQQSDPLLAPLVFAKAPHDTRDPRPGKPPGSGAEELQHMSIRAHRRGTNNRQDRLSSWRRKGKLKLLML